MKKNIILGAGATLGASTINCNLKPPLLQDLPNILKSDVITINRFPEGIEFNQRFNELMQLTNTENDVETFFTVLHVLGLISKQINPTILFIRTDEINILLKGNSLSNIFNNEKLENIARIILEYYSQKNPDSNYPQNVQTLFQMSLIDYMDHSLLNCFCNYHAKLFKDLKENDTVVNFNYDEIGDITLFSMNKLSTSSFDDLPFKSITFPSTVSTDCESVKYLKLHGSFNWELIYKNNIHSVHYILNYPENINRRLGGTQFPIILPTITKSLIYKEYPIYSAHIQEFSKSLENIDLLYIVGKTFKNSDSELNNIIKDQRIKFKCMMILVDPNCKDESFVKYHEDLFNSKCIESYLTLEDYYNGKTLFD